MPTLMVDLNDLDDLRHAQAVIATRVTELEGPSDSSTDDGDRELSPAEAAEFARSLWTRIQNTENTRSLVRCFVEFDGPFTLEEAAAKLDQPYDIIRARVFRFGRTEGKLFENFGARLLQKVGEYDTRYTYTVAPNVRKAVRDIIRSEG